MDMDTCAKDDSRTRLSTSVGPVEGFAESRRAMYISWEDALPGASFLLACAHLVWGDGSESTGWGRSASPEIARRKAIGEAVERAAYTRLPQGAFLGRRKNDDRMIHPDRLIRYAAHQYARPDFPFRPFEEGQSSWWVPARSAVDGGEYWVVADCICNPRAFDAEYRRRLLTHATTSGCASGGSWKEALARATLELIERDAFMRHWMTQTPGEAVDSDSLPAWAKERRARLVEQGCKVAAQCLTLGVHPVWLVTGQHRALGFTTIGTACGLEADGALQAAWDEMETIVLTRLAGVPAVAMAAERVVSPADHGALYATRHHFMSADAVVWGLGAHRYNDLAQRFEAGIEQVHCEMQANGHPVYAINLSLEEADTILDGEPVHTLRAIAPGMVPLAFGYGLLPLGMGMPFVPEGLGIHPLC
jgi:ribosomal protein S12 methylthiotransferase accessory factor